MPSVNLILESRLGILSEEYWPLDLVSVSLASFDGKSKVLEVRPQHGKHFIACKPLFEVGSSYLANMLIKQRNQFP